MKSYKNKIISILGDSISTFAGYIPAADGKNRHHAKRYPQDDLLTDVNETWWMRILNGLEARLGVNESWAGSSVGNVLDEHKENEGPDAALASVTRITNLGSNGTPDLIFFFGGTNDIWKKRCPLGEPLSLSRSNKPNLAATKWGTTLEAYREAILRLRHFYPAAELISILPGYVLAPYTKAELDEASDKLIEVCNIFGVKYVDLREDGITPENACKYLPDKLHPNAAGMALISNCVLKAL